MIMAQIMIPSLSFVGMLPHQLRRDALIKSNSRTTSYHLWPGEKAKIPLY